VVLARRPRRLGIRRSQAGPGCADLDAVEHEQPQRATPLDDERLEIADRELGSRRDFHAAPWWTPPSAAGRDRRATRSSAMPRRERPLGSATCRSHRATP
jgi:hypothetical protein